ncbi:MAG: glycosyltransferase, partial [Desulfitobacterium hafniense]|nr:glycosyltransferase [Desulfitobacterium hafniense]
MQSTITLAMIVKNEAENLKNCLESVHGQVDEIVIVDTGSSDDTLTIARSYTDKVYPFVWRDDFSAARNFAISKASCEWILSLDADEELVMELGNLRSILASDKKIEAYLLPLYNPSSDTGEQYNIFNVLRLFRNNGKYQYSGEIHEQVIITEANCVGLTEGVYIRHKMLPSKERRRKRERNLRLLKKACQKDTRIYCQNPFLQYYLGVEWLILGKPAEALPHLTRAFEGLTDDNILFRAPALRYLVICLHALGKLDQGICLCLDAALKYPEYTDIFYLCGILFEEKKEYELAIKWFSEAIKNGPPPVLYSHMTGTESFLAFYHLGNCYEQIGQAEEAIKCFEQALQANSNYFYPVYTLFLRLSSKFGLKLTQEYLKDKGYLTSPALALAVADLFYTSNNPVLARQSLEAVT